MPSQAVSENAVNMIFSCIMAVSYLCYVNLNSWIIASVACSVVFIFLCLDVGTWKLQIWDLVDS